MGEGNCHHLCISDYGERSSSVSPVMWGPNQCLKQLNDIVGSARKKIAGKRAVLHKTGGGAPKTISLTDLEERAAALTGAYDHTAMCVGAESILLEVAEVEPPAAPREESLQGRPNEEMVVEETEEMVLEEPQENIPQSVVMVVVHEKGGVVGLEGSFLPAATGSSWILGFRPEEAGPSRLQQLH